MIVLPCTSETKFVTQEEKFAKIILSSVVDAISEGLNERELEKKNQENQKKEANKKDSIESNNFSIIVGAI